MNEIAEAVAQVSRGDIEALVEEYYDKYEILLEGRDPAEFREHVAVQAAIEIDSRDFWRRRTIRPSLRTSVTWGR